MPEGGLGLQINRGLAGYPDVQIKLLAAEKLGSGI